jgi:hypothetical protein
MEYLLNEFNGKQFELCDLCIEQVDDNGVTQLSFDGFDGFEDVEDKTFYVGIPENEGSSLDLKLKAFIEDQMGMPILDVYSVGDGEMVLKMLFDNGPTFDRPHGEYFYYIREQDGGTALSEYIRK